MSYPCRLPAGAASSRVVQHHKGSRILGLQDNICTNKGAWGWISSSGSRMSTWCCKAGSLEPRGRLTAPSTAASTWQGQQQAQEPPHGKLCMRPTWSISATSAPTRWMPTTLLFCAFTTTFIIPLPSCPDKVSFNGLHPQWPNSDCLHACTSALLSLLVLVSAKLVLRKGVLQWPAQHETDGAAGRSNPPLPSCPGRGSFNGLHPKITTSDDVLKKYMTLNCIFAYTSFLILCPTQHFAKRCCKIMSICDPHSSSMKLIACVHACMDPSTAKLVLFLARLVP